MAKYNSGLKYNHKIPYNSAPIVTLIIVSDSGSGSDSVEVVSVLVGIDDNGAGVDVALIDALCSAIDSGLGQDIASVLFTATVDDSGTGADSASVSSSVIEISDSGSGVESVVVANTYYLVNADGVLMPLNVKVLRDSNIDLMPEIKVESDTIPGRHGEIYFDSNLGARIIELSIATEEYTVDEREALKRTLAQYLNPSEARPLVFASDLEKQYMVKYAGKIDLAEHNPSWMRFTLPFKSATSFVQSSFEQVQIGSGTITNVGNEPAPLTIEISGPVTNPSVVVGTYNLTYTGTINSGSTLIIDVEAMTVELDGVNALPDYSGGFPWLSVGNTTVTAASAGVTTFKYRGRWL